MIILRDHSLVKNNTFGLNIDAKHYCKVASVAHIAEALEYCREHGLDYYILGGGSNILFTGNFPEIGRAHV